MLNTWYIQSPRNTQFFLLLLDNPQASHRSAQRRAPSQRLERVLKLPPGGKRMLRACERQAYLAMLGFGQSSGGGHANQPQGADITQSNALSGNRAICIWIHCRSSVRQKCTTSTAQRRTRRIAFLQERSWSLLWGMLREMARGILSWSTVKL